MALPALRQDLGLLPAPAAEDGSPCWTVHDPAANRYYRIGWVAFEVLSRWHLNSAEAVLAAVNAETGMDLRTDHLAEVADFLARHHLLDPVGPMGLERLVAARKAAHQGWLTWLNDKAPLVRAATESLCVSLNGQSMPAGGAIDIALTWTEE